MGRLPPVPPDALALEQIESRAVERSLNLSMARQNLITLRRLYGIDQVTSLISEFEIGVAGEREESRWQSGSGLALPLPFFDQGQARRAVAKAEIRQAKEEYAALAIWIRSRVRAARHRLTFTRDKVMYYRDVPLPLRERIVIETQLQYNAMHTDTFELLAEKRGQIEAEQRHIGAVLGYWLVCAVVEHILNGWLPSEIASVSVVVFPANQDLGGNH